METDFRKRQFSINTEDCFCILSVSSFEDSNFEESWTLLQNIISETFRREIKVEYTFENHELNSICSSSAPEPLAYTHSLLFLCIFSLSLKQLLDIISHLRRQIRSHVAYQTSYELLKVQSIFVKLLSFTTTISGSVLFPHRFALVYDFVNVTQNVQNS